jgi:hypothetical protein
MDNIFHPYLTLRKVSRKDKHHTRIPSEGYLHQIPPGFNWLNEGAFQLGEQRLTNDEEKLDLYLICIEALNTNHLIGIGGSITTFGAQVNGQTLER